MKTNFNQNKIATLLLALSMFFTGASGLVNEYVLSTVSIYIMGSSIEQFSITIALMLGMMGVGSSVQKFVGNTNLIQKFIIIEITLAVIGSFAPIIIYSAFGYMEHHFNLVYYFLVMSIGFLIGFEIPFIIRINEKYAKELKTNLSTVMAADYTGSFVGALVWVYLLLPSFNLNQISFLVSGANFFVALLTLSYFIRIKIIKFSFVNFFAIVLLLIALFYGYFNVIKWEISLEQKLYSDPIISTTTTKYQHLTLTHNKLLDEYRLYINGNVQFSSLDEVRYHEILVHPAVSLANEHKDILVLGGGDGLALRELQKYKDIENITLVDLDPGMISFATKNTIMQKLNKNSLQNSKITVLNNITNPTNIIHNIYKLDDKKQKHFLANVNIFNIDANSFLQNLKKKFDVIIIDFPDPSSIELSKLYSKQFYMKLKRVMKRNTKLVIQATSPYHAKESFLCIGRTLESAGLNMLPFHLNIPSFGDWGWYIGGLSSLDSLKQKIQDIESFMVNTKYLTTDIFKTSFVFGKKELHSEDIRINSLMRPILLDIYTKNSWLYY